MLDALVLLPVLALAEEPALPKAATHETALVGGLGAAGAFGAGDGAGGLALSVSLLHRIGFVELGGELYGAAALGGRVGSLGALLGVHVGSDFSARAFVAAGFHGYDAVGRGLLTDDPGVSGSSPYVGGRLVLGYSFGRRTPVFLGVSGLLDEDLERHEKTVVFDQTSWFSDGTSRVTNEHTVGQTTWGVLVVVGREFDWAPY